MTNYPPPAAPQPGWAGPQPYAYGGGRPPMQSLGGLKVTLLILLPIAGLGALLASIAFFQRANFLDRFLEGELSLGQAIQDADDADAFVAAGMLLFGIAALATAIVFIIWQWRHAKNAESLGHGTGLGPGWAIGGWFIPLANFVLPCVQLFSSSKGSDRNRRGPGIVVVWAVFFGLGYAIWATGFWAFNDFDDDGNVIFTSDEDVEDAALGDRVAGAGMLLTVVAAGVAMGMVNQLSNRQTENYSVAQTQPPADPMAGAAFGAPPPAAPVPPGTYPAPQPQQAPPPPPPPPGPGGPPPNKPDDGGSAWPAPPG